MSFKRLDEVAKNASRTFEFKGEPVVFINTGDVLEGSLLHKDLSNPIDLPGQAKKRIKKNDILYSEIRPGNKRYAFVDFDAEEYVVSTKFMVIEVNDIVLPKYLYIFLTSSKVESELKMIADSRSGTFPQVTFDSIGYLQVYVPNQNEQKEIINFWESLDQKIHLNQQTNETLEAMAQATFKSWFVDFDPVRAKIEANSAGRDPNRAAMAVIAGISLNQDWDEVESALDQKLSNMTEEQRQQLTRTAQLFPDELVDSEIGEVPKGWGVKTAEEILKRFRAPKRVKKDEVEETGKVVVLEQGEGIIMGYHNQEAGYDASPNNPYFIFGDHTCITHLVIEPFDIAPNVIPLQGEGFDSYWTYYAIRDLQQFQEYRRHWSELKVKEVVTPNNELDELFAEFIKPLIININKNRNENLTLSQLRDTLLPKLISGEVGV